MKNTSKRIVIAGGTGTLGSACAELLLEKGYEVVILSRRQGKPGENIVQWDPANSYISENVVDGAHAVLCLTGIPIDTQRWTKKFKQQISDSRVVPARFLNQCMNEAKQKPKVYIGASGIGIYGDSGSEPVDESFVSESGSFMVRFGHYWEDAHLEGNDNVRKVLLRTAVVLNEDDGFVDRLALPGRFGIYPYFGSGKQYVTWIHIADYARIVLWLIEHEDLSGPYNVAAPSPVPIRTVMRAMRSALTGFGIVFGLPEWVASLMFGEMSAVLLDSCNASSQKILNTGFTFRYPEINGAFDNIF